MHREVRYFEDQARFDLDLYPGGAGMGSIGTKSSGAAAVVVVAVSGAGGGGRRSYGRGGLLLGGGGGGVASKAALTAFTRLDRWITVPTRGAFAFSGGGGGGSLSGPVVPDDGVSSKYASIASKISSVSFDIS